MRFELAPCPTDASNGLQRALGVSQVLADTLVRRGLADPEAATAFLALHGSQHDPLALGEMASACAAIEAARADGRRIVVHGDYDVDGVCATALLVTVLRDLGADAEPFLPSRFAEGYGLAVETVERLHAEGAGLLVTVDCGITAVEGVACAREAGVEVIVTDHHLVPSELPAGAIVVNPRQPGCEYPEKELAATGIAMKIALAVARRAGARLSPESLLRAACLGTIADLVPLTGENRSIAAAGLAALATARAPGLRALLAEAGLAPGTAPTSEDVAFRIGPRLNAAGRIDTAMLALSLFEEPDRERAAGIARELSAGNAERQALERRVVDEARARIEDDPAAGGHAILIEADPGWHRGVLGIAASRLAREYHRPVLLFGIHGDRASGSGRSIPGVSLHAVLSEIAHRFTDFGGHSQAVGGSLPADRFEAFRGEARELFAARVPPEALERVDEADAELPLAEIGDALCAELARLEPHGSGNPAPVFLARGVRAAAPFSRVGASGVRGRLGDGSRTIGALAWKPGAALEAMTAAGAPMDVLYRIENRAGFPVRAEILAARPQGAGQ